MISQLYRFLLLIFTIARCILLTYCFTSSFNIMTYRINEYIKFSIFTFTLVLKDLMINLIIDNHKTTSIEMLYYQQPIIVLLLYIFAIRLNPHIKSREITQSQLFSIFVQYMIDQLYNVRQIYRNIIRHVN